MRTAGRLAHEALDLAETLIEVGRTTEETDKELHTFICAMVYNGLMNVNDPLINGNVRIFVAWTWTT